MSAATESSSQHGVLHSASGIGLPLTGRTVLLAIDDSQPSTAAIHVAAALAAEHGAVIHAISIIDDRAAPIPPPLDIAIGITDELIGHSVHAQREAELRDRIESVLGKAVDWPRKVSIGAPASTIASQAQTLDAAVIVMGLRRHGHLDRALHDETTLNVIRLATCPVLAVAATATGLPRVILAAIDFSQNSVDAVRVARSIARDQARIHLTYVPSAIKFGPTDGEGVLHDLGTKAGFAEVTAMLATDKVTVDHVVLHHEIEQRTAELLLEYANTIHADLISAGCVGRTRMERLLLGSVSTDLIRHGRFSMLVAPFQPPVDVADP